MVDVVVAEVLTSPISFNIFELGGMVVIITIGFKGVLVVGKTIMGGNSGISTTIGG